MTEPHSNRLNLVLLGGSSGSFVIFEQIVKLATKPFTCAVIFVYLVGNPSIDKCNLYFGSTIGDLYTGCHVVFGSKSGGSIGIEINCGIGISYLCRKS